MDHNTRTPNAKTEQNATQNNTTATHMFFILSQKATNPTVAPAPGKRSDAKQPTWLAQLSCGMWKRTTATANVAVAAAWHLPASY